MARQIHIAITGATGFIGAAVALELMRRGAAVTALVRPESCLDRLQKTTGESPGLLCCAEYDTPETAEALKLRKPDIFVHCAWQGVGGADRNDPRQITENIPMTLAAVKLAAAAGCSHWIGLGSQAEYGNQDCRLAEDAPCLPTTLYGKAKLAAGIAGLALCGAMEMTSAWVRVFSTYGPDDSPGWFIPYVTREFLAGRAPKLTACGQLWDYLFVGDAADAIAGLVETKAPGIFNLGSGVSRPLKEYIEAIRHAVGAAPEPEYGAIPYRPDQVMHLEADISRIAAATDWRPKTPLSEGVAAVVAFEKQRSAGF